MPRVSQNALSKHAEEEILETLFVGLANIRDSKSVAVLLKDLLTPTEQIMIAKRLMVALLIQRGYRHSEICKLLKLSHMTVTIVARELKKGGYGYKLAVNILFRESRVEKMLEQLGAIFNTVIPPVKGSRTNMRRWKQGI